MLHTTVFSRENTFAGWPANNGGWLWRGQDGQDELLVGFTAGGYQVQKGHNITEPYESLLARSLDGGETWQVEKPANFLNANLKEQDFKKLLQPVDFTQPGLALRIVSTGYHGNNFSMAGFFFSLDRGRNWMGPFRMDGLDFPDLSGSELTPRTDYLVDDDKTCLFFLSARKDAKWGADRVFCARTNDGGITSNFVSWIVPPSDPFRAVMPSSTRLATGEFVTAIRRRDMYHPNENCWLDAYLSPDNGLNWMFLSRIAETGTANGNPPALLVLHDGRLCCVYGNRSRRQMLARFSIDNGRSWQEEVVIREGYLSHQEDQDFGYPRFFERSDGWLVALYYWADSDRPLQHITATLWKPE